MTTTLDKAANMAAWAKRSRDKAREARDRASENVQLLHKNGMTEEAAYCSGRLREISKCAKRAADSANQAAQAADAGDPDEAARMAEWADAWLGRAEDEAGWVAARTHTALTRA